MRQAIQFAQLHASSALNNRAAFAEWATSYDTQPNPRLKLEERYLKRLLPEILGRWLRSPVKLLLEHAEKVLGTSAAKSGGKPVWLPLEPEQIGIGRSLVSGQQIAKEPANAC